MIALGVLCAMSGLGLISAWQPADAQQQTKTKGRIVKLHPVHSEEIQTKQKANAWTLGLAAGLPEGAPLRFATELARVVDDGTELRVLPIVTRGIFEKIFTTCCICAVSMPPSSTATFSSTSRTIPRSQASSSGWATSCTCSLPNCTFSFGQKSTACRISQASP